MEGLSGQPDFVRLKLIGATIINCYATGNVTAVGAGWVGGLVGKIK